MKEQKLNLYEEGEIFM